MAHAVVASEGLPVDSKLNGAGHSSFSDYEWLLPQEASLLGLSQTALQQLFGTINPNRAIQIQRVCLAAFFDRELRHRHRTLLDGPDRNYPEISFAR
ncbi:hypothetical protein ACH41H_48970 [Streptomyces sp. NPDC020800]|uniref:hypothetical protein n=1 Tax=Streptomyces sp. NPDC020800 TaxID=3365092 RepID=UPI00379F9E44